MSALVSPGSSAHAHRNAVLMLLLANLLWGLSFPVIKALTLVHVSLLPGSGNWFITSMTVAPRFLLAVAILLLWRGRSLLSSSASEWRQGLWLGCFAGGGMLFQNDGLQFTDASVSAFLTQLYAILIPLWVAARTRRNPGWRIWCCCALVLTGAAVLGRFDWHTLSLGRGEIETLVSSVFFMGQILTLERPCFAGNRALNITFVMLLTELVLFSFMAFSVAPSPSSLLVFWGSLPWVGMTLMLTVFCTLGAFLLMNLYQPRISATEAGLIYCVEPIFGSLMALCLPALLSLWAGIAYANEPASWTLLLGGGLITAANVWMQWPRKAPAAAAS